MKLPVLKFLTIALIASLPLSIYASNTMHQLEPKANWNRLEVHNNLNVPITYRFGSGLDYSVSAHNYDSYHSKGGDSSTSFNSSYCTEEATGMMCTPIEGTVICNPYIYCVRHADICNNSNTKYNADLIKHIEINGINQCIVTCLDGSNTSCIAK